MKLDRKQFLQILGASAAVELLKPGEALAAATAKRWAMVIDTEKCVKKDGCTECIQACNKAHNVPVIPDPNHEVKWIWKEPFEHAFPSEESQYAPLKGKAIPVFCNHCNNPPCVRVCPTKATWRREDGIVMMDWHRCIGCRYCIAACPYGSRSFNYVDPRPLLKQINLDFPTRTKGVVEKCTFCEERLAEGLPPACVEVCPEKALVFGDVSDPKSQVRELLRTRFAIRRKPELGTTPEIYYIV